mgnify:FL=1
MYNNQGCEKWYITNPITNRRILYGGKTHQKLMMGGSPGSYDHPQPTVFSSGEWNRSRALIYAKIDHVHSAVLHRLSTHGGPHKLKRNFDEIFNDLITFSRMNRGDLPNIETRKTPTYSVLIPKPNLFPYSRLPPKKYKINYGFLLDISPTGTPSDEELFQNFMNEIADHIYKVLEFILVMSESEFIKIDFLNMFSDIINPELKFENIKKPNLTELYDQVYKVSKKIDMYMKYDFSENYVFAKWPIDRDRWAGAERDWETMSPPHKELLVRLQEVRLTDPIFVRGYGRFHRENNHEVGISSLAKVPGYYPITDVIIRRVRNPPPAERPPNWWD